jgi:hypothetical protein
MVNFSEVAGPLANVLGLSLVVERVLEVGKNVLEPLIGRSKLTAVPDAEDAAVAVRAVVKEAGEDDLLQRAEEAAARTAASRADDARCLEELRARLRTAESGTTADPAAADAIRREILQVTARLRALERQGEWNEMVDSSLVLAMKATPRDQGKAIKSLVLQLLGFATGIVLARVAGVGVLGALGVEISVPTDYVLTGLLIGGGSKPMHVLVEFITQRKVIADAPVAAEAAAPAPAAAPRAAEAPAVITAPATEDLAGWVDVPYEGGVDRERLEHVHRRKADPDLIVYHHTAMDSRSTFDDVVRTITDRTDGGASWITGYNCVILADGSVHPFCRWDRYGNHAVGYNARSLGIAFNGNFETDPNVPFSNPTGRMGATRPTEAQLAAGARIVALWTILYGIDVHFGKTIIPHKQIASKACPGSQFPYDEFQRRVEQYRTRWEQAPAARARIEEFNLKSFLHVTRTT